MSGLEHTFPDVDDPLRVAQLRADNAGQNVMVVANVNREGDRRKHFCPVECMGMDELTDDVEHTTLHSEDDPRKHFCRVRGLAHRWKVYNSYNACQEGRTIEGKTWTMSWLSA